MPEFTYGHHVCAGAWRDQKRMLDYLELEGRVVMTPNMGYGIQMSSDCS